MLNKPELSCTHKWVHLQSVPWLERCCFAKWGIFNRQPHDTQRFHSPKSFHLQKTKFGFDEKIWKPSVTMLDKIPWWKDDSMKWIFFVIQLTWYIAETFTFMNLWNMTDCRSQKHRLMPLQGAYPFWWQLDWSSSDVFKVHQVPICKKSCTFYFRGCTFSSQNSQCRVMTRLVTGHPDVCLKKKEPGKERIHFYIFQEVQTWRLS